MNAMEEMHLEIETLIDGERIGNIEVHDPFHTTRVTIDMTWWEWFSMIWHGRKIDVCVKLRGDDVAHRQWFRTDPLPRGGNGGPMGISTNETRG
jgi:hypothetical protein